MENNESSQCIEEPERTPTTCMGMLLPVKDALQVLNGRWKLPIIISLTFGAKRFKQISKDVHGITDRMLSKELKDLETNQLVKRTVQDSFPPTVEYSITPHGKSLEKVIDSLRIWGIDHRNKIMKPQSIPEIEPSKKGELA